MIIKYKDKEYNIEPNYQSLINLKNQCFNNHFHFIMKEVLKNEGFSKWFYSEYKSVSDFNNNPNKCLMCNTKTNGIYCKKCRKTDEYKNIRVKKIKQTKLKRYGSENYNNAEKQKLTNSLKTDEEKTIISNKIKNKLKSKSDDEKLAIIEKRKLTNSLKSSEEKIKTSEKISLARKSKSSEEKTEIYSKVKQTKLKRYNDENYNNIEKQKLTFKSKTNEEKLTIVKKRKQTNLEKYGNENYVNTEKAKQTKLERYNDENFVNPKKAIQTKLERYNDENYVNHTKAKQTKLMKYGDENYNNIEKQKLTFSLKSDDELEEIKKLRKQTNLIKYGDENYNNREKYKQTCLEKYGVMCNLQSNETKEKIKQTNLERYGSQYSSQMHFKNINDLNENYVKEIFIRNNRFLIQEFMEYFNFEYTCALKYKRDFNIQELNKTNLYKTQQFIFDNIKTENKIFNDRSVLDGKELDIYLPDIKLAIEYNGLLYHSEGRSDIPWIKNVDKNYHLNKTLECQKLGITLFHIFEGENLDLWLSMINNKLGLNERIFARKCYVAELKSKDIINFLNDNHIQGYVQSSINLGLFYTDGVELPKLVSVMTFSKPRFNKKYEYELIRFCSLKNTSVIGGANKLLKYFINKYNPKSIISYANRRFSNGSIYETLGFKKIGVSALNYFYFKDSSVLESRNKYQKHKLSNLLEEFDPNLTESENMFKNGYRKIYDCGNLVYELVL